MEPRGGGAQGGPRGREGRDDLRRLDLDHVWHPYTQMADFAASDFPVIVEAQGRKVRDADGTWFWDGTSSMWVTVHGHRVPEIDQAVRDQLDRVAHATLLGQAGEPSIRLAARLAALAPAGLGKVFLSDDGSTAVESALKMAAQFWAQQGCPGKARFATFDGAYHGDTLGAIAAAPVPAFHAPFEAILPAPPVRLPWPDTFRGPHRDESEATRDWALAEAERILAASADSLAAAVVEPHVQMVGGVRIMPKGYLAGLRRLCTEHDVLLIADEVATGVGRTGTWWGSDHDQVRPDLMAVAKGLTGGYLPVGATLATARIHDAFLGAYADRKAFYHGHSYTGNALGCAAAVANLDLLERNWGRYQQGARFLRDHAPTLAGRDAGSPAHPARDFVGEVRGAGWMWGVDLVRDERTREPFAWQSRAAWAVYEQAKARGLLARPYASTGMLVPPLGSTVDELGAMLDIYAHALGAAAPALARLREATWDELVREVPA